MALPNTSGVQNAGVNPTDVQQKNDVSQAMNNFFREFSARMDNILNVRGNVQAGVFNAFGNNVLTRGGTQLSDLMFDTIKGLFADKEEEKEDPVTKALKEQLQVLNKISDTLENKNVAAIPVTDITDLLTVISGTMTNISQEFVKLNTTTESLLLTTNQIAEPSTTCCDRIVDQLSTQNISLEKIFTVLTNNTIAVPSKQDAKIDSVLPTNQPMEQQSAPVESAPKYSLVDRLRREDTSDIEEKPKQEETKQITILEKILDVLFRSDKKLEKLVKDSPLSTREADVDSARVKSTIAGKSLAEGNTQEKSLLESLGIIGSVISGIKDFGIIIGSVALSLTSIPKKIAASFSSVFTLIRSQVPTIFTAIKGLFTKGFMGILGSLAIALAPLLAMLGVKTWAENASINEDTGELSTTGNVLDKTQKALGNENGLKPMSEMTGAEKIAENANTGLFGLNSSKKEANKKRYLNSLQQGAQYSQDEANALSKHFDITVPQNQIKKVQSDVTSGLSTIEKGQSDLKAAQQAKAAPIQQSRPIVQSTNTTNNQTIMPTRSYATNTEPGLRRYMDNMLVSG